MVDNKKLEAHLDETEAFLKKRRAKERSATGRKRVLERTKYIGEYLKKRRFFASLGKIQRFVPLRRK